MTPQSPAIDLLALVRTHQGAVKLLRWVLTLIDMLERGGWKASALRPVWPRGLPAPPLDLRPAGARRELAHELRLIQGWLRQRAAGQAVGFPVPGLQVSLWMPAGSGPGEIALGFPPDYNPPVAHWLRGLVAFALRRAGLATCARPTCGALFVRPARGRPKRYCRERCAWADRARLWRAAHPEAFRAYRILAYSRKQRRAHGARVRIQTRRRPHRPGA